MSKQIKQMEMDSLKGTFSDVRDMVVLSASKLSCQLDHQIRAGLRKKNIRLQLVKNSLTRRVFRELGLKVETPWSGPSFLAWGGSSLADLSKEIEGLVKKNDKILSVKIAVCEGQEIPFGRALKMPTRLEAIGRVAGLILSPAERLVSQLRAPGGQIAGQLKTLAERPPEAAPTAPAAESTG